jgi:hypothetical protein
MWKRVLVEALIVGVLFHLIYLPLLASQTENMKAIFEEKFEEWKKWVEAHPLLSTYIGNKPYYEMIKLGIPALPYMIEKMEKGRFHLGFAVWRITKKDFERSEWPEGKVRGSITRSKMYVYWFHTGRKQTPQRFEKLYNQWKNLKRQNKTEEAEKIYQKMKNLGVDVLPFMIEKFSKGDLELREAISYLTDESFTTKITPEQSLKWWWNNREKYTIKDHYILEIEAIEDDLERANKWIGLLKEGEHIYHENAKIGLCNLPGEEDVVEFLIAKLRESPFLNVKSAIVVALGRLKYDADLLKEKAMEVLLYSLNDKEAEIREAAAYALKKIKPSK